MTLLEQPKLLQSKAGGEQHLSNRHGALVLDEGSNPTCTKVPANMAHKSTTYVLT